MMYYAYHDSPLGRLLLTSADGRKLAGLYMETHKNPPEVDASWVEDAAAFAKARQQLDEYFAGSRQDFDLELDTPGTEFQEAVWAALRQIPHGQTVSYGRLAAQIGRPKAVRAVGSAVGRNPLCVIIPCHRVMGSDGKLHGYVGGPETKAFLLGLEGVTV